MIYAIKFFRIAIVVITIVLSGCHRDFLAPQYSFGKLRPRTEPFEDWSISIISLIATPDRYDGKMVMVGGFLSMRPEDVALYLDSDFDRRVSAKDGIWLNVTNQAWHPFLQKCNGRYCVVVGKFTSVEKGHMSGNSGGISEVDTITVYR